MSDTRHDVYVLTINSRVRPTDQIVWFDAYTSFDDARDVAAKMLPHHDMKQVGRNMWHLTGADGAETWIYRLHLNIH